MIRQSWEFVVPGTPEELWPYAGDSERFNRLIRNPAVTYREEPDARGGIRRYGRFRIHGIRMEWREHPYEWRENESWSVLREYSRGPLSRFQLALRLVPDGPRTRMVFTLELTARSPLTAPGLPLVLLEVQQKTKMFAERIKGWAAGRFDRIFTEPVPTLGLVARSRIDSLSAQLIERGFEGTLVERLAKMVSDAPDFDLLKIRPYAVADAWKADRQTALRLFLHATRLGLLDMSWDLVCPACRGAKERHASLGELSESVHCASCNIDFRANFDSSVELTFRPSPAIRKVEAMIFCVGGPGNTPHVVAQRYLAPGSSETLTVPKVPGAYRLRSPQISGQTAFTVTPDGPAACDLTLTAAMPLPAELAIVPGGTLRLQSTEAEATVFIMERVAWADHIVRASAVTAMQEFRDLFAAQNLAPGVEMGISRLAFLFSDLKASTAMYALMGDASAFSLVQDHFRILEREVAAHGGAVVKTIGDAIMAVFPDAGDCVKAGLAIQRAIADFNATSERPPITVKLGAHLGPTIAVSLNDRLDYFGTTVNVAARVQNESHGGDLVLTEELLADPGVQTALSSQNLAREGFEVRLKGLESAYRLTRLWLQERQGTDRLLERMVEAMSVPADAS
ncbi:Adenylate and Guanylate cyclase catalytic domain protein [compost metagenome]